MLQAWPLALLAAMATAQPEPTAPPLTLEQSIEVALQQNPRLAAAAAELRAAAAGEPLAASATGLHAALNSTVRYQGPVAKIAIPNVPPIAVAPALDPSIGVTFELPLDTSGRLQAGREQAAAATDLAAAQYEQARDQLVYEVIRSFYAVLSAQQAEAAAQTGLTAAEEAARVQRARRAAAQATPLAVQRAENDLTRAEERLSDAGDRRHDAEATFNTALARPTTDAVALEVTFLRPDRVPDPLESIAQAEAARPELAASWAALREAAAALRAAAAANQPSLEITGGALAQRGAFTREPLSGQIALGFSWPFAERGRGEALTHQAEASRDSAQQSVLDTRAAVELQVQQAILAMNDAQLRIDVATDSRLVAERALADTRRARDAGMATRGAVLDAEANLAQAVATERAARYDLSVAYAAWARATGRIAGVFLKPE